MSNEELIEIRDRVLREKKNKVEKKLEIIGEMEYKKLDYMYDIEDRFEDVAHRGLKLEIEIEIGDITEELNKLVKKYLRISNTFGDIVTIKGYLSEQSQIERERIVKYLDGKIGIGVNNAYNYYLSTIHREHEYYINRVSKKYGFKIRINEYEVMKK